MRTKTIFIIIFTVLITVFLMINTDKVKFDFIFGEADVSKLLVIGVCTFFGVIIPVGLIKSLASSIMVI